MGNNKEKKQSKKDRKREKKDKKRENKPSNKPSNKKSELDRVVEKMYLVMYISFSIDMLIILMEILFLFFKNLRLRFLFGMDPSHNSKIIKLASDQFIAFDEFSQIRFTGYKWKFAFSVLLVMLIYGICIVLYVINKSIVFLVKGIRKAYNPVRKGVNKLKMGFKLPQIPYNCVPIPIYTQFYYYLFLTSPKQCKFKPVSKSTVVKSSPNVFNSLRDLFTTFLTHLTGTTPIILWTFFAVIFACWVGINMLDRIYNAQYIQQNIIQS